ncbi:aldo/keto reductase [Streptomyces sp. NPDC127119]|uniref:aldo/keto reductase n=1 Tax=Streptomyces sp. NPDC127119 TaxID=3345370 RepID=UPI00364012A6
MKNLDIPTVTLNTGHDMPQVGLGTWPLAGRQSTDAILAAISTGYRLIDTAAAYGNEDSVGTAVRESGLLREELFITTKLRGRHQGGAATVRQGLAESLETLGLDYVDLYLIHWPNPNRGLYVETYAALLELAHEGFIRSVGVSNFTEEHLRRVVDATGVLPAVNQRQVSPSHAQTAFVNAVSEDSTVIQAWSPLERNSGVLEDPAIVSIAERLDVSPSQVVIRWLIERGLTTVPHSGNPERQRRNADVFHFSLEPDDIAAVTALDSGKPTELTPDTFEEF